MTISKVYIDMDGVLADFDRGVEELAGVPRHDQSVHDEEKVDAMWAAIRKVPHFYNRLELMPEAAEMFRKIYDEFGERCEILTGLPKPWRNIPNAAEDKTVWVKRLLSEDIKVNAVIREDKIRFCSDRGCVLIDDLKSNIKAWQKAGGTGILHTSPETTIVELKRLAEDGHAEC